MEPVLQRNPDITPTQMKGVSVIQQCGTHLLTLINDVLDLAKIEAGKVELYPQDFHLSNFLMATAEICHIKAQQKGIQFTCDIADELPVAVHADDKRLRQVLLNLLSNAVKFTEIGSVTFQVMAAKSEPCFEFTNSKNCRLRFLVKDTGVGMERDRLEAIFLPFEQLGSKEHKAEGTGLGLAISQEIIEQKDGPAVGQSSADTDRGNRLHDQANNGDRSAVSELRVPTSEEIALLHEAAQGGLISHIQQEATRLKQRRFKLQTTGQEFLPKSKSIYLIPFSPLNPWAKALAWGYPSATRSSPRNTRAL